MSSFLCTSFFSHVFLGWSTQLAISVFLNWESKQEKESLPFLGAEQSNNEPKQMIRTRTLISSFLLILFYCIYIESIKFIFHIIGLVPFDFLVATMGSAPLDFEWTCHFDDGAEGLPILESESSSASLSTYRQVIAAESEHNIYARIRNMENQHYYNLPPQNNVGDYETLVRQHFDRALNVEHYLEIWNKEFQELNFLETQALLQDKLHELLLKERKIENIISLSPYDNIRKEAYFFIKQKVEPLQSLEFPFQRNLMDGCLNSFKEDLNANGRESGFYREFYRHFTDEEFRRSVGLPLP